jgi:V8-like Glu-specific endopeptidase
MTAIQKKYRKLLASCGAVALLSTVPVAFAAILFISAALPTQARAEETESADWLIEKLKNARPAPTPPGIIHSDTDTASPEQHRQIGRDIGSGEVKTSDPPGAPGPGESLEAPPSPAVLPSPGTLPTAIQQSLPRKQSTTTAPAPPVVHQEGPSAPIQGAATPPSLLLNTTAPPFNTVHKVLMEFYSSESGENHYYICSAFAVGSFHLGTAGHCVYNFDPNDDGSTADASWATEVWAWAAQTDQVEPFAVADFPFGVAKSTYLRTYTGWTTSQNYQHDWAVITLDRRQGDHTGWMGREAGVTTTALNFTGYPVEPPYVPAGSLGQYAGVDNNNVSSYSSYQIQLDAFIYGGHSGGPSWRYSDPNHYVQGLHSTSDRAGMATDTRLTTAKLSDITTWMAEDETARAPVARPNLIEYWFDLAAKDIINPSVEPGGNLQVEYNLFNAGFAAATNVVAAFYLSSNDIISIADHFLGSATFTSLGANTFSNPTTNLTVPGSVPTGSYYLGWILSTDSTEYNTDDNTALITSELVNVSLNPCTADSHEPDNTSAQASSITLNVSQAHNICPGSDVDWAAFTLPTTSEVVLSTTGTSGDSRLWLYNTSLTELAFDDDSGTGLFSTISRTCGNNALPAGTYYVKVDEYGNNNEIDAYNLTVASTTCVPDPADIRVTPQTLVFEEPETTSAQAQARAKGQASPAAAMASAVSRVSTAGLSDRRIKLRRGAVDVGKTRSRHLQASLSPDGRRHMLMQFGHMPSPAERQQLAQQGINILTYLPNQAFWVSTDNVAPAGISASGGISWAWVPSAEHKMSARIEAGDIPPNTKNSDGTISVSVLVFDDVAPSQASSAINDLGAGVRVSHTLGKNLYQVRVPPARVRELANLDEVRLVEPAAPPIETNNQTAASRVYADILQQAPYNLDGSGITVGVWDQGAVDDHTDFGSRVTVVDAVAAKSHSSHVAGTIGGSGLGNAATTGMAPNVNIRSYDWTDDNTEMRSAANNDNMLISNHSYGYIAGWTYSGGSWIDYGDSGFGLYSNETAAYDATAYDTGLLIFKSAGNDRNDGPDCSNGTQCDGDYESIGFIGNAKNIVAVCALSDSDGMSAFSSWGPTDDGRVKPDLCANGVGLNSTDLNNSYSSKSGTSMASPSAAGTAALLFQRFIDVHGSTPGPALLKTLMIHGANDLFNTGPDYKSGWGIIDAATTLDLIDTRAFVKGTLATTSSQISYQISHPGGALKATLGWTDPEGSPGAATALVNDLNLTLVAPGGTTYNPWVLNPDNPALPATSGVNNRDNVEQVLVTSAESGIWTAVVTGFAIPMGPQTFSLVADELTQPNTKQFIVYNDGDETLNVSSITPAITAPWITIAPDSLSLNGRQAGVVDVTVDYSLAPAGTTAVNLVVNSNDLDEQPYPGGVEVTVIKPFCPDNDSDGLCDDDDPDDDNDGMSDSYELTNELNPLLNDAGGDKDEDGLSNLQEFNLGTLANNSDSDGDGASDKYEVDNGYNPLDSSDCPDWACRISGSWRYKLWVPEG